MSAGWFGQAMSTPVYAINRCIFIYSTVCDMKCGSQLTIMGHHIIQSVLYASVHVLHNLMPFSIEPALRRWRLCPASSHSFALLAFWPVVYGSPLLVVIIRIAANSHHSAGLTHKSKWKNRAAFTYPTRSHDIIDTLSVMSVKYDIQLNASDWMANKNAQIPIDTSPFRLM